MATRNYEALTQAPIEEAEKITRLVHLNLLWLELVLSF